MCKEAYSSRVFQDRRNMRWGWGHESSPASHDVLEHDSGSLQTAMNSEGCTATAKQQGHCPAAQPQDSLPIEETGTSSVSCIAKAEEAK